jgi:Uma2 family endonuclease
MTTARAEARLTPAQYLTRERNARVKSELLGGYLFAMSGASRFHNYLVVEILGELRDQLRGSSCDLFVNDMRVKVSETGDYLYPDVVVACGEVEFEDTELDTLLTPTVIIEVLSPSTEAHDPGAKWISYRELPTLAEYLLVAQDRPSVEHYVREREGWMLTVVTGLDAVVQLPSIDCVLHLCDLYRRVPIAAPPTPSPNEVSQNADPPPTP